MLVSSGGLVFDALSQLRTGKSAPKVRSPFRSNAYSLLPAWITTGLLALLLSGCGGSSSPPGNIIVQQVSVSVSPVTASVAIGQTQQFLATVTGTTNTAVTWEVNGTVGGSSAVGAISTTGLYTAPAAVPSNPTVSVTATSVADTSKSGAAAVTITTASSSGGNTVPAAYFGLHLSGNILLPSVQNPTPWPTMSFGSLRIWDDGNSWQDVEPKTAGVYDWTKVDELLQLAGQHGVTDIMYTMAKTPTWASSNPNDQSCVNPSSAAGSCDPPSDVDSGDQLWKSFVTALVNESLADESKYGAKIKYYEVWNEPDIPAEWTGTMSQLATMASDARAVIKSIDPSAQVATPPPVGPGTDCSVPSITCFFSKYFAPPVNGGQSADVVTFHGYPPAVLDPSPESIATVASTLVSILTTNGLISKPLFDTEASWATDRDITNSDEQAAFVASFYLLHWPRVSRLYWYAYDNQSHGTLYDLTTQQLNAGGVAYQQVYNWMVGATVSACSASNGSVYTCAITRNNGAYQALAVWDSSQSCAVSPCTTSNYTVPSGYVNYIDLSPNKTLVSSGQTIAISAKPILLQNQ